MNTINTRCAIERMTLTVGARLPSESRLGIVPVETTTVNSCPNLKLDAVRTSISFSTYGPDDEHIATVVTNQRTAEVIREIPSKAMQKVAAHIETLI